MVVKLLEIRDRGTFMPMFAFALRFVDDTSLMGIRERFLLHRAGYGEEQTSPESTEQPYIILGKLDGVDAEYDPFAWGNRRITFLHQYLIENWNNIHSGDLIDIEFINGESTQPKVSEFNG